MGIAKKTPRENEDFWKHKLLLFDTAKTPTLEIVCLVKNPLGQNFKRYQINSTIIDEIVDLNWDVTESNYSNKHYLSTIQSDSINQWLVRQYLGEIEVNLPLDPFLLEKSIEISKFLKKQKEVELEELAQINQEFKDKNLTKAFKLSETDNKLINPKNVSDKESNFTKFALYLMLGGGVFAIYSVITPSGTAKRSINKISKIELARRKRWLKRIFDKGWIDRPAYHFLLKKIESLPEWLGGIKPPIQSAETFEEDENSVALSSRKSGESVVKTNDTSCDKTSP